MPNSRKRRRQPSRGPRRSGNPASQGNRGEDLLRARADLPILVATDAAEARGDARAALELIERDLASRADENFWRLERLRRLMQLAVFGSSLPRWATSRWILAQAAQHLDPRTRTRALKALEIAVETRGGAGTLVGVNDRDARCKVMDHDWVYRQVWLYELGALHHFVSRIAAPDLLAGADRINDWIRTPMGAFRFVGETSDVVSMVDVATGQPVEALNIGSASLLDPGECAIGRLVPIEGGSMFESAPLFVPDQVAQRVAEDPAGWLSAVADGCREAQGAGSRRLSTVRLEFGLLTDVPVVLKHELADMVVERLTGVRAPVDITPEQLNGLQASFVRAAMHGQLGDAEVGINPWPAVAATFLDPGVFVEFGCSLSLDDVSACVALAHRLAEPARAPCLALAREIAAAA